MSTCSKRELERLPRIKNEQAVGREFKSSQGLLIQKEEKMSLFKPNELKLLWPFYIDGFISPLLYFLPAFFVIYFNNLGLSITQIGILLAMVPLFSLIFEIPTGAFADIYGRKASVILSLFLSVIGFGSLFFFTNFYTIAVIFAGIGIATTFSSGAKEAWVVDLIKPKSKEIFAAYNAKIQAFMAIGLILSGVVGAVLVNLFGLAVIWPATAFSYLISLIFLLFAHEERIHKEIHLIHTFKELLPQAKKSFTFCWRKSTLFKILLSNMIILFALNFGSFVSWTPFLTQLELPNHYFGYLWSLTAIAMLVAAIASHVFLKPGKERIFILGSIILSIILAFIVIFINNLALAIFILCAQFFFIDFMRPATRVYFHSFIPSQLRATIGSIEGMLLSLQGIICLPIVGFLVDTIGAKYTIFMTAILLLPALFLYFSIKKKKIIST